MDYPQASVSIIMLCICAIVGLPLWWNTTKVYRADLPSQKIISLRNSLIKLKLPVDVTIVGDLDVNLSDFRDVFIKKFEKYGHVDVELNIHKRHLDNREDVDDFCSLLSPNTPSNQTKTRAELLLISDSSDEVTHKYCGSGFKVVILLPKRFTSDLLSVIMSPLDLFISQNNDNVPLSNKRRDGRVLEQSLPPSPSYRITFTLAVANPSDFLPTWDIETAIATDLMPVLNQFAFLGPFHISSQILYYADVSISPKKQDNVYYYTKARLPLLINPLESRLNTYTSTDVGLNFIVYIPPKQFSPLVIKAKKSDDVNFTAFHSPRWGGIQFYSFPSNRGPNITVPIGQLMPTFVEQFKLLVGLVSRANVFQGGEHEISDWIRLRLVCIRTFDNLRKSISTLSSLSKLLDEIANIVIKDDVRDLVEKSVYHIEKAKENLKASSIDEAYRHSKNAYIFSEQAFYDSSLLALLYFPDDQKYAIYVPLFLPIALPMVISFVRAVKWLKGNGVHEKSKEN